MVNEKSSPEPFFLRKSLPRAAINHVLIKPPFRPILSIVFDKTARAETQKTAESAFKELDI